MSTPAAPHDLADVLGGWLRERRWFPAKGQEVALRVVARLHMPGGNGQTGTPPPDGAPADADDGVLTVVVALEAPPAPTRYLHVPVVLEPAAEGAPEGPDVIGVLAGPGGPLTVHDGSAHPAYLDAVVGLLAAAGEVRSPSGVLRSAPAAAMPVTGPVGGYRQLSGEQSNTSVIVDLPDGPVIVKIIRGVQAGENPDVSLPTALAQRGSLRVPRPAGSLRGTWVAPGGEDVTCDLVVAAEFLAGSEDAWRVATRAVAAGRDFVTEALDLGAATAEVHAGLADALGVAPATPARLGGLAEAVEGRLAWAFDQVDELDEELRAAAETALAGVRRVAAGPAWQRIHGDLHLGQVLRPPGRGWVLLDFEGEPLRPLAERVVADCPLRDVASMLRSFDYAAAFGEEGAGADAAHEWAAAARDAFCRGYAGVSGRDPREDGELLGALELDKALYEVVYEARNRPDWVHVPLAGVRRLLLAQ